MSYPFYLAENLAAAAASHDHTAFSNLVSRNFDVIMHTHTQSGTMKKLRVAQLEALISRAIYRTGAEPERLFKTSQVFLEKLSKVRVSEREALKKVLLDYCSEVLAQVPETPHGHPNLLQRFLDAIDQPPDGHRTVEAIAKNLNVSPSHLSRAIRSATGRTPSEFIRMRKLSRARERLASTSVTRAALDSGFNKVSAFIALFRKHYGETPGAYKRRLLLGA